MPYLLDTNAAIALMKGHPALLRQVQRVGRSQLRLCAPVEGELWFGVAKSLKVEENRTRLLTLLGWLPSLPFSAFRGPRSGDRPPRSGDRSGDRPRFRTCRKLGTEKAGEGAGRKRQGKGKERG